MGWYMPVIPTLRRLRQEDHESKVSLLHIKTLGGGVGKEEQREREEREKRETETETETEGRKERIHSNYIQIIEPYI
jgi:hypothetical protein